MISLRLAPLVLVLAACAAPITPPPTAPPPAPSARPPPLVEAPAPPRSVLATGRLVGHDGKPMKLAHVHLGGQRFEADASGVVQLSSPKPGFFVVRLTGVDHAEHRLGLLLDGGEVRFEARLGTHPRHDDKLGEATLDILERPAEGGDPRRVRRVLFRRKPNGSLVAEVKSDREEILYQLSNVAREHAVNGPVADAHEYDGDGDYVSRVRVLGGKLQIRLDPASLPPPGRAAAVVFADPESRAARLSALHAATRKHLGAGDADDRARRAEIRAALAAERDPEVQSALRMAYLVPPQTLDRRSEEAKAIAQTLLRDLRPEAPMWGFWPTAAVSAADLVSRGAEDEAYLDALGEALGSADSAPDLLADRIRAAARAGREEVLSRLHPLFQQRFPDARAKGVMALHAPSRKVRPGRALPDFDLAALADGKRTPPGTRITLASLRGKVTLLDFWGTWCRPCVAEMKTLHDTFARFKDRGFAIVSVSSNDPPSSVRTFRAVQWPMPWAHVVLRDNGQEETLARFEVRTFPSPILIDARGVVLAIGDDLRGEALPRAVAAALDAR